MRFHKNLNVRLAMFAAVAFSTLPAFAIGNCGLDLGTSVKVQRGRQYVSNGAVHQTVDITNLGSSRKGAVYFVVVIGVAIVQSVVGLGILALLQLALNL